MMPTPIESSAPFICNIRPEDGASCTIILESTVTVPKSVYPLGQEFKIVLGESDSGFGDAIEEELIKLSTGQTSTLKLPSGNATTSYQEIDIKVTLKSFQNRPSVCYLTPTQKLDIAKNHKAKGVELFKNDQIEFAFRRFSKALKFLILLLPAKDMDHGFMTELNELRVQCYSNMALCQMKFHRFDFAIKNCSKALSLDSRNVKCLYRKAEAYYQLGKHEECKVSCVEGLKVDPHSKSLKRLQEKAEKEFCER